MTNLCILVFCETCKPLSSILGDVGQVCNSYDWAQSLDKLKRALISILMTHFLWNILLFTNGFNFLEDCSSLFDMLLRALMGIDIRGKMMIRWSA